MTVRRIGTAGVIALVASSTLALAQTSAPKQPLSKLTCEQFLAYEATVQPKVVYWAVAYGKGGKPEGAVLDVEATEKVIPVIIEKCKAAPKDSFLKAVKSESGKSAAKK
jgi:acid stress chaperone HdeA